MVSFGRLVDIPWDDNCGYYAIIALLGGKGVIGSDLLITMFRQDICGFIRENLEDVIKTLDTCAIFWDPAECDIRIQAFLQNGIMNNQRPGSRQKWT